MTDVSDRPLRADAERNRQRILAAASTVFAERGLGVSMDDIAVAAGVGVGTVYRRFPDKDALIDALFDTKMQQVREAAEAALAIQDPWESFAAFMRTVCASHAKDKGLKEAMLSGDRGRERVQAAKAMMAPIGAAVLRRAQEAGVVRDDLRTFDMPMLHMAIADMAEKTREVAPGYWERMLTVVLDGLAVRRDQPSRLPCEPLTPEQFAGAMASRAR